MVEYFNQKANISGTFPLGSFNSAFSFTGSKHIDAAATKTLSLDGFYNPLAKVQLMKSQLVLQENVKRAVPVSWDPSSLARFVCPSYLRNAITIFSGFIIKVTILCGSIFDLELHVTALLKILGRTLLHP